MSPASWRYWGKFAALASGSLALLFFFVFGILPKRFLLQLEFNESGFAYPVVYYPLYSAPPTPAVTLAHMVPRGPAERLWAEYLQLVEAGESEAALALLREYLDRYPDDLDVRLEYGRALWRLGRLHDAADQYRLILAARADPTVKLELARILVAAQRWDEALRLYEQLVQAAPHDVKLRIEQARTASWAERYDLAASLYGDLVQLRPGDLRLQFEWARVLYWSGQPELAAAALAGIPPNESGPAIDSLSAAISLALPPPPPPQPTDTVKLNPLEQARALVWEGAVDSALAVYRGYLGENPDADELLLELADVFEYHAGAPDSAMAMWRLYLERHPEAHDIRLRLARQLAWSGQLAAAEAEAERIVKASPNDAAAWALLGELHRWRGNRVAAAHAYRRALDLEPAEPTATQGEQALREQVDAELASLGSIGPAGTLEYFVDSEDFTSARWRGSWSFGSPRNRVGFGLGLERSSGFDLAAERDELTAVSLAAIGESWWLEGELRAAASVGFWLPDSGGAVEPDVALSLTAPNTGGALYKLEYRHGPAHHETRTLEAARADLRYDLVGLEHRRPLSESWDLSLAARGARYTGAGTSNTRADAAAGVYFKPDDHWLLGYQTRGLSYADAAPVLGRRLYWDPEWSWSNAAVVGWRGATGPGWWVEASASPGFAWLRERDADPTVVFELGALLELRRRIGLWTVSGRAGFGQSRADGYRSLRLEFGASRGFEWRP